MKKAGAWQASRSGFILDNIAVPAPGHFIPPAPTFLMPENTHPIDSHVIARISALVERLRPRGKDSPDAAASNLAREIARLRAAPDEAAMLGADVRAMLAQPCQTAFYAETGVQSALGFWLELRRRLYQRWLPPPGDLSRPLNILLLLFQHPHDPAWIMAIDDAQWLELANVLGLIKVGGGGMQCPAWGTALENLLEAVRLLSYRLAGEGVDREMLRADPALEQYASPFLAQNATLIPMLAKEHGNDGVPTPEEIREIDVLLDQCEMALDRVRRNAAENGISIRLTYKLARMRQLIGRQRVLLDFCGTDDPPLGAIRLMKSLLTSERDRDSVKEFVGENISLLARNVTDHASRHGEHYIAADNTEWLGMARSAAGGGIIIAIMAMIKLQLAHLHLPPLTEGIAFGLNYGIGFALIHLLGFVVATKQPAMTAAAIAATIEEARPRDLERLGDLAQNVVRTQFIAVLGNVGLALPVAIALALLWSWLAGAAPVSADKAARLIAEIHPIESGALFFAAIAGIGLFLSGLVSGYFDNQARYFQLGPRIASAPRLAWLGADRPQRFGAYLDAHYGAILGNLFFGMYLGLMGEFGNLTGLPVDIRHVAFSSANLGTILAVEGLVPVAGLLPWAVAGLAGIALVNLAVSFSLALYVAMKSRRLGTVQIGKLGLLLWQRFKRNPLGFFSSPGHG